jgi:hypothetical protein
MRSANLLKHDKNEISWTTCRIPVRPFFVIVKARQPAKSLRAQPSGEVLITDGPYLETKGHVGGFWVLKAADLDEALVWGRKAAVACRAPVEVRAVGVPRVNA